VNDGLTKLAGTALLWRAIEFGGAKLIFLIRLLILARLLSPDDFGLLAIAMTAIWVFLAVTDFGMVPALIQRQEINDQYYNAAWTVVLIRALIITGVLILAAPVIANIFNELRAVAILQILALRPLLEAAASIKLAGLMRDLNFRSLAFIRLSEALLNTIIAIALAQTFGVWALVVGSLAGASVYLVMSYFLAPHRPKLFFDFETARPLIKFGRWIFVTGLITILGDSILKAVISRQLGAAELGLYFLGARLAFLPAELASEVAGSVAFSLYARLQSDIRQATQAFRGMLTGLATFLLPICALIIILAPSIVHDLLGQRWGGTVPVIRILALASLIGLFGEAIIPILKGLGKPSNIMVIEGVQTFLLIVFVWFLTGRFGLVGAVLAWLPAVAVSQVLCAVFSKQLLYKPFQELRAPLLAILFSSGVGAIIAFGVDSNLEGILGFAVAILSALVAIVLLLWAFDRRFDLGLTQGLASAFPQVHALMRFSLAKS
jgi:O-antigen/teichoic acid export membrane protein